LMDKEGWNKLFNMNIGDIILPFERKICGEEEMKISIQNEEIVRISKEIEPDIATGEFVGIAKMSFVMIDYFKNISQFLFAKEGLNLYMEAVVDYALSNEDVQVVGLDITGLNFVEIDFEDDYKRAKEIFGN